MPIGYWCPVLHAHLPFVRHPEYPHFMEEDWFYEALTETYVPLLRVMDALSADGVDFRLTMTLTPSLVSMMKDPLLVSRYEAWLDELIALAKREIDRTAREDLRFAELAVTYHRDLSAVRSIFRDRYGSDLVQGFRRHGETGRLEIITCGATHGFLPLMDTVPEAARAQVLIGAQYHESVFGAAPRGIWLPECAYLPGHEAYLREAGISFSILEAHGLTDADPRPRHGVLAPILSPEGVAFFGRDMESSRQVWSAEVGYPGDPEYREFYRDIGWELPLAHLGETIPDGLRKNVGLKYFRVTGKVPLHEKEPYVRERALARTSAHATHFLQRRVEQVQAAAAGMDRPPVVLSPYDAELFGHWWFEGPEFLEALFRQMDAQDVVKPITPPQYLELYPECDVAQPPLCTWGARGYAEVWLNPTNDWIYPHLEMAALRMVELARSVDVPSPLEERALAQAARELLLAQSSDWAFIMKTGTTVEYAKKRTRDHIARFTYLYGALLGGGVDEGILAEFEERDNIFPRIDFRIYR